MFRININYKILIRHIFFWSLLVIYFVLITRKTSIPLNYKVIVLSIKIINYVLFYYILFHLAYRRYWRKDWMKFFFTSILSTGLYFIIEYVRYYHILSEVLPDLTFSLKNDLYNALFTFIVISSCAYNTHKNRENIRVLKDCLEKEKLLMLNELNHLQGQFNSHITFNFLNYCYSSVHKTSEELANIIEVYSDLLQFTFNQKPDEKVLLRQEVDYLQKFIELLKQLNPRTCIQLQAGGNYNGKMVVSRLFITFIENAVKHGVSVDPENPIKINITANDETIHFSCWNLINHSKKVRSSGTGLINVSQSLDLNYPGDYDLKTIINENQYHVELKIDINEK